MSKVYNIPINKKCIIIMIIIAFISVIDMFFGINRLLEVLKIEKELSFFDVSSSILFGLTMMNGVSIMDIVRWMAPYLIVIYFISNYIENIILTGNSYMWINRFRSRERWIKSIIKEIFKIIAIYLGVYFISVCIGSILITGNISNLSKGFLEIYTEIQGERISYLYILVQFLVSFSILSVIIIIHTFINIKVKSSGKGEIVSSIIVVMIGVMAKTNIYNPIMIFKHSILDKTLKYNVNITLILSIIIFLIATVSFVKIIEKKGEE